MSQSHMWECPNAFCFNDAVISEDHQKLVEFEISERYGHLFLKKKNQSDSSSADPSAM